MNKTMLRRFILLVPLAAAMIVAGCEIAVDFDRTKIPTDGDGSVQDSGGQDVLVPDTGADTGTDAGSDASDDAGDSGLDAADGAG